MFTGHCTNGKTEVGFSQLLIAGIKLSTCVQELYTCVPTYMNFIPMYKTPYPCTYMNFILVYKNFIPMYKNFIPVYKTSYPCTYRNFILVYKNFVSVHKDFIPVRVYVCLQNLIPGYISGRPDWANFRPTGSCLL
jgi:hypothetical protein